MYFSDRDRESLRRNVEGVLSQVGVIPHPRASRRFARQVQKDLRGVPQGREATEAYRLRLHEFNRYLQDIHTRRANLRGRFVRRHKKSRLCNHPLRRLRTFVKVKE